MNAERPQDETRVGTILAVGIAGTLLTIAAVIALSALFTSARTGEQASKAASGIAGDLSQAVEQDEAKLATFAWVDRDKGIVRIPITRAMEILAAEAAAKGGGK